MQVVQVGDCKSGTVLDLHPRLASTCENVQCPNFTVSLVPSPNDQKLRGHC